MATAQPLVAVVDDDQSVLRSLARLLGSAGYNVNTFASAQEFLGFVANSSPKCLVLDVHMPMMNGFELHARLKQLGYRLPVVYLTAHDTPQTILGAKQTGTAALLFKPLDGNELLAVVSKVVKPAEHLEE
jgi:FixJ family two-component response regulator